MGIFDYTHEEVLGAVESVDTSAVIVRIENDERLRDLQVNHLVAIQSSKTNQYLIGLVSKIVRKPVPSDLEAPVDASQSFNSLKVVLIGTHIGKVGEKENTFSRTLSTVPTINAECFLINGERL